LVNAPDRYAVIGHPIAHSKSPAIHAAFARQTGQNLIYERLPAALDAFATTVAQFARDGGKGLNVTAPFKVEAFALARQHSERAAKAAACNTLAWRGTHWFGDNTDGAGLVRELTVNLGLELRARDILILGAGGAARGLLGPLLAASPRQVIISNRNVDRANELASLFAANGALSVCKPAALAGARFDIVLNATSASSSAQDDLERFQRWPSTIFSSGAVAYDLTYADEPTPFMRWAQAHGATHVTDGLGMLIEQAAESFFLWRGVRPDTAPVFPLLRANWGPRNAPGPIASER
jgi:shikimate dehydrogenase